MQFCIHFLLSGVHEISISFIELNFSIAGIVCDIKGLNMADDLEIKRSMMKSNMSILRDLNKIQTNKNDD